MGKLIVILPLAAMLFASGCASVVTSAAGKPQIGQHGEQLVWVKSIRHFGNDWKPDADAANIGSQVASISRSSSIEAGVVGALVGMAVGKAGAKNNEDKIQVFYFSKPPSGLQPSYPAIFRKQWPGSSELREGAWAILSNDEVGPILLPCDGCEPVVISD